MWSWLHAIGLTLYYGVGALFVQFALPLFAAAMAGATIGSIRRWYAARWQLGFLTGLAISAQHATLGCIWGTPSPFTNQQQVMLGAAGLAFVVAAISSAAAEWWFCETEWHGVRTFRDHPWRWLRWRTVHIASGIFVVAFIPLWYLIYQDQLDHLHRLAPYLPQYQAAQQQWQPHGAWLNGELGERLNLVIRSRRGLSPEALKLLDDAPWPIESLDIFGAPDVRDVDLIDAVPSLSNIKIIRLLSSPLSDQCLPALAAIPQLELVRIQNCALITAQGAADFHKLRPDVKIQIARGHKWDQVDGQRVLVDDVELELP